MLQITSVLIWSCEKLLKKCFTVNKFGKESLDSGLSAFWRPGVISLLTLGFFVFVLNLAMASSCPHVVSVDTGGHKCSLCLSQLSRLS